MAREEVDVLATRRERVILEVEDRFTGPMAEAAAKTALLKRELDSLSGTSVRSARTELDQTAKSADKASKSIDGVGKSADASSKQIDRYSGRLRLIAEAAVAIGPAAVPISAAAIPAIASLSAGMGALAGAAGVTVLAFKGVGDALKAFNEYQLEPTAENLAEMQAAMEKIGPAGASLVRFLSSLEPELRNLQNVAREGLFPGIEAGISELLPLLPQVQQIVGNIATELGRMMDEAGGALSGEGFAAFFSYLETDAATILSHFGRAIGNVAEGLASLTVAFGPLSLDFSSGLERMTRSFADWAAGLSQTEGFQNFVDYVRESGPMVLDLLGSLGEAVVALAQAMAPWGSVVLPILTSLADILTVIASSPVGAPLFTAAAGFIALNRAVTPLRSGLGSLSAAFTELRTSPDRAATAMARFSGAAKIAAGAAGMGLLIDGVHRTNEGLGALESAAGGAMAGLAVGGPWGAAIGGAVGALGSLATANESTSGYVQALTGSLEAQTGALTANSRQIAAKALEDAGALEIADQLGLNLGMVTEAALGNEAAMAHLTAQMQAYSNVDTPAGVDMEMLKQREAGKKLLGTLHDLAGDTESTVASQKRVAAAARRAGESFEQQSAQMTAARSAARKTAQGFITLGDSLDDSKVSLRDWLRQLEQQAEALRNFAQNARTAAKRGLDDGLIKSLQEAGPAGAMRMKQLANATDAELGRANRAWRAGQQAIRDYVNITVPPKKVKVDNDQAFSAIDAVKHALAQLRDKTVTINTVHTTSYLNKMAGHPMPQADGGVVPKTGLPYADRHLYLLADGERITSNRYGQADRYATVLEGINRNLPRNIIKGMLADGGTTGDKHRPAPWFAHGGIGPNSQLFGINHASLSIKELAERIDHLSKKQLRGLGHDVDNLAKRGLDKFAKSLEKASSMAEKEWEQAKERLDEERQQLKDLREARRQFMQEVTSNFRSDIFGGTDLEQAAKQGLLGPEFAQNLLQFIRDNNVELQAGSSLTDYAGQYLATLSPQQIASLQAQASIGTLQQNSQGAEAFTEVLEQLRAMGLTGGAFNELAASGNLAQAQAYLQMGPDFIKTLMQEFKDRNADLKNLGQYVGNVRFGADIREQLQVTRHAVRVAEEQRDELRLIKQTQREVAHRLDRIEKHSPKKTGEAVGEAINSGSASSQRRPR